MNDEIILLFVGLNKQNHLLNELDRQDIAYATADRGETIDCGGRSRIVRIGSTHSTTNRSSEALTLNKAAAIHDCYNKPEFRERMSEVANPSFFRVPFTTTSFNHEDLNFPYLARPFNHAQGRGMQIIRNRREERTFAQSVPMQERYYQALINKTNEYRLYMFRGGVLSLFEKVPEDRNEFYWGGDNADWVNVGYNSFPGPERAIYEIARAVYEEMEIDLAAIDLVKDEENNLYILEANTCPAAQGPYMARKTVQVIKEWARNPEVEYLGEFIERER